MELPNVLHADEQACLRSLTFRKSIPARVSLNQRFKILAASCWGIRASKIGFNVRDWKHRGFFWIQGNPGSDKSTLMKKVYSHVLACLKNPSSVIAAFFNARGNKIEKSSTGLLRTLLHTLCQRISALRDLVVKAYAAKCRLLSSDWQWQLSELKDFLAAVVTSSVLG